MPLTSMNASKTALGPNESNPKRYPKLAKLKAAILSAQSSIQRQMEALLSSPQLQDLLQDRFVTQRNGRSVLPIRASAKRTGIGIVHDSSSSGETVFIEPKEVIELHNQQRLAEAALQREELAIRQQISQEIG